VVVRARIPPDLLQATFDRQLTYLVSATAVPWASTVKRPLIHAGAIARVARHNARGQIFLSTLYELHRAAVLRRVDPVRLVVTSQCLRWSKRL
jgi:hypothetical protein